MGDLKKQEVKSLPRLKHDRHEAIEHFAEDGMASMALNHDDSKQSENDERGLSMTVSALHWCWTALDRRIALDENQIFISHKYILEAEMNQ